MPAQKKIEKLQNLVQKLKEAKSVVLIDYQGLTHQQLASLRTRLKKAGSSLMVTKNTLFKLALENSKFQIPNSKFSLVGPTATLFIADDPIPPLKALSQFLTEFGLPKIKVGILEGRLAEKEKILKLATLPSRETLTTQIIAGLKAPTQRLTLSLVWNLQKLALVLNALKKKQEDQN